MSQPPYCFKFEVQNSGLLAFYRHDFIILNHFPKILMDKNQNPEEKNYGILLKKTTFCVSP